MAEQFELFLPMAFGRPRCVQIHMTSTPGSRNAMQHPRSGAGDRHIVVSVMNDQGI
jgi:hypothetical protein